MARYWYAAKRNRLSEAASQVHFHVKQEATSNGDKEAKAKIGSSGQSENPVRRRRRPKKETDSGVETGKARSGSEQKFVSTKEMDSRAKIQKVTNEVLDIVQYPKSDKLCQALDDILIDGVPLAVSAAQRGFSEFYLRTFIQAITIHIRQTCPELL
ncbi:hypothetical protein TELCIR_09836 [Teladorsagia circumcincta]|uniref:Uncharacterized protein n=1 Tax=Teladorsagia circumcincta TaxID=45464 RepID=A0A2G9UDS2_TELCI|nr:hypothetical protein TELCIR_09836 [Teladorsagia circumcincta]